ncbi:Stomatin-like protein 2, mitochondrial [Seminavis robusta]|uniref:Stomatin-like protein 2, mitochondrial n=1 Tax=Seminavis robusta TaxID=568900 RepID=A0A9N8DXC5_9STRA|nr:Stomatin-like protein 2, mitochondrial [Seminavis robusta]|eukprot:Sro364_g127220.1 Stomatin-like protein 2, mitochondrial (273) ;mRNA; f:57134-58044
MFPTRVVAGSVVAGALASIKIVSQGNVAIVERLGRFQQCLNPGLHFVIPLVDRQRITLSRREQVFDIPPQDCISSDNAPLSADAVVYWILIDPEKAYYAVMDLELAIQNLVLTQLRSEIGKLTLDKVRDNIPNPEILGAMEQQMAAERTKRAVVIKSEGELARAVNEAEGAAQSRLIDARASAEALRLEAKAKRDKLELEAQGAAQAIAALVDVMGGDAEEATKFQLNREYIEAQRSLATSENAKVVLSSDAFNSAMVQALSLYDVAKEKQS